MHFPGNGGEHVQQKCVVLTRVPKLADARALRSEVAALPMLEMQLLSVVLEQ